MMTEKLLPVIDPESRFFWEMCAQQKLMIQQCEDCGKHVFYPRSICPHCMSDRLRWVESSGRGRVYSYTVARRPGGPGFEKEVPYIVAIIELEEGVRMMSTIVDIPIEEVRCGMPVQVVFEKLTEEITLPKFAARLEG